MRPGRWFVPGAYFVRRCRSARREIGLAVGRHLVVHVVAEPGEELQVATAQAVGGQVRLLLRGPEALPRPPLPVRPGSDPGRLGVVHARGTPGVAERVEV